MNKSVRSFEFSSRPRNKEIEQSPGPGMYQPDDSVTRFKNSQVIISPLRSSQRSERLQMDINKHSPGPGQYNDANLDKVKYSTPNTIINPESQFSPYQIQQKFKHLFTQNTYVTYKKKRQKNT